MTSFRARLVMLSGALLALPAPVPAQDDPPATEPAQHMPLAAASLLLDITRTASGTLVAVGERGHVVRSADGGRSWSQAESVPTRATLTSIAAHGGKLWAAGHDSAILASGDDGLSWTLQYVDPDRQQPVLDLLFLDDEHGLAVGAYGLYLVTWDGGLSWEDASVSDEEWHLNAIADLGEGRLFIAGEAGWSYLSEDGGETWELLEMPYDGSMWGALPLPGGCVLAFGLRGHAQQSCDGGQGWEEQDTGTVSSLSGGWIGEGQLLLVGNSGAIVSRDADGGYRSMLHPAGVDFAAVIAVGEGAFVLVGEDGVHHWPVAAAEAAAP